MSHEILDELPASEKQPTLEQSKVGFQLRSGVVTVFEILVLIVSLWQITLTAILMFDELYRGNHWFETEESIIRNAILYIAYYLVPIFYVLFWKKRALAIDVSEYKKSPQNMLMNILLVCLILITIIHVKGLIIPYKNEIPSTILGLLIRLIPDILTITYVIVTLNRVSKLSEHIKKAKTAN